MSEALSGGCTHSPTDPFEYTALQLAARKGSVEQVRYLIDCDVDLDAGPEPALHLALRRGHDDIALILLQAGADFEIRDSHEDYPIHIACALGYLDVVHTLCALGCSVEVPSAKGLFPLHLAAKNGHIHIVRCLCAAGCNIDAKNTDNIRADITALKYGHNNIAELLDRLRATGQRDAFARQLVPTSKPALRLSLRLLGHCGSGKTSLVKSLNAGLFSSLFRRSSSLQSNKSRPSSPINSQIEMDVTSRQNSLTFESPANYQSTNGIHIQNVRSVVIVKTKACVRLIYKGSPDLSALLKVFCVHNLIVINMQWLGAQLIGELLSAQFLLYARVTGVYTLEDFQASYNQCDAIGVLELLKALELCIECEVEGEIEYEFPIYNQTETLPGLWDSGDPRYRTTGACYGGLRYYTAPGTRHLFSSVFTHLQVSLRRSTFDDENDMDLYQWCHGSKLCTTTLETLVTLSEDDDCMEYVEVKIRGPRQASQYCFYFLQQVLDVINEAVFRVCPGLLLERHILSNHQLKVHHPNPFCYSPQVLMSAMLEAESTLDVVLYNPDVNQSESILQLALFNDVEIAGNIHWGCALKVSDLSPAIKLKLCGLLDPPEPHGRDWCLLALRLGLNQERIASLDSQHSSHTMRLLSVADCSIGNLITSLIELDRNDAAEVVLRSATFLKVIEPVEI